MDLVSIIHIQGLHYIYLFNLKLQLQQQLFSVAGKMKQTSGIGSNADLYDRNPLQAPNEMISHESKAGRMMFFLILLDEFNGFLPTINGHNNSQEFHNGWNSFK